MKTALLLLLALLPLPALADSPVVEDAWVTGHTVHVTLSHRDTGWQDYADGWEVLDAAGTRLGLRVLVHPHVNEQPFTRSLTLEALPQGPLFVRPRGLVEGWSDTAYPVRR